MLVSTAASGGGPRASHKWKLAGALAAAACLVALQVAADIFWPGPGGARSTFPIFVSLATAIPVAGLLFAAARAARRDTPAERFVWDPLAVGTLAAIAGAVVEATLNAALNAAQDRPLALTASAPLYILGYGCIAWAAWELPVNKTSLRIRLMATADAGLVMLATGIVWWLLVIGPPVAPPSAHPGRLGLAFVYPVCGLTVGWVGLSTLGQPFAGQARRSVLWLVAALLIQSAASILHGAAMLGDRDALGSLAGALNVATLVLLGMAGWTRILSSRDPCLAGQPARPLVRSSRWFSQVPFVAAIVSYGMLITGYRTMAQFGPLWAMVAPSLLTGLLVARQWLGARENEALHAACRANEARLGAIMESLTDSVLRWRPDGICTYANQAHAHLLGVRPAEVIGMTLEAVMGLAAAGQARYAAATASVERPHSEFEVQMSRPRPARPLDARRPFRRTQTPGGDPERGPRRDGARAGRKGGAGAQRRAGAAGAGTHGGADARNRRAPAGADRAEQDRRPPAPPAHCQSGRHL